MVKTIDLDSKFLIRLPKNVFRRQINKMQTNDEIIKINIVESRLRAFDDENLKEKARQMTIDWCISKSVFQMPCKK